MLKQTAVEWLVKELNQEIGYIPMSKWDIIADKIQQALAMEKEQICQAFDSGDYMHHHKQDIDKDGYEYYNETYGGQDE